MLQQEHGAERVAQIGQRMRAMAQHARKPEAVLLKERVEERERELNANAAVHERRMARQEWVAY